MRDILFLVMAMRSALSIYVHIPFCVRKCLYCDFLSFNAGSELIESYFNALGKELSLAAGEYREYEVVSIFIGGGTPSFVDSRYIVNLMALVKELYTVREDAEITIEANPASTMYEKLLDYRSAGINRLSIGAQSLNDEELKRLGRVHDSRMFLETYENARKAGFDNINIDVMSALPGQSPESYLETLQKVTDLHPEHISAYSLIVEEGTPFFDMELDLPDEETDRLMYHETKRLLEECGYHRYEISNYALGRRTGGEDGINIGDMTCRRADSFECRHNKVYWQRGNYLGVGIGAASMVENVRWSNTRDIKEYVAALTGGQMTDCAGESDDGVNLNGTDRTGIFQRIRLDREILSARSQMEEFMFLGLRLTEGVSTVRFRELFGKEITEVYGEVIDKYEKMGLLEMASMAGEAFLSTDYELNCTGRFLRLTEKGLDVSNTVMADFLL